MKQNIEILKEVKELNTLFQFRLNLNLHDYDLIILNSSAGKDSQCALDEICTLAIYQGYPMSKIKVSHQCLGLMEWPGTYELAKKQADYYGVEIFYSKRKNKEGIEETLLEYAIRRGKWPSNKQRWCTSDFKRGPGSRIVTQLTKNLGKCKVLHIFGFRADESPSRSKKSFYNKNERLSTKQREVFDYLPIHDWSTKDVWERINSKKLEYHYAYDLGMPRLSCVFCIFSPFDALVLAGMNNYNLLLEYIAVEDAIQHLFREDFSLWDVKKAIDEGYQPKKISNWIM
jgi:3'-phosphoadenosine 5'-phosphosulfate sulfotransferase (PAPS reductase)/FAD synthetase